MPSSGSTNGPRAPDLPLAPSPPNVARARTARARAVVAERAAIVSALFVLFGCDRSPYTLDDVLRLNHVQARGTHNSYHLEPAMPFDPSHRYSHAPLDVQLAQHGIRQLELDIHLRDRGFFEVFHLPGGVDDRTTCLQLAECLATLKRWSDANPWHLPIIVWLEPKDEDLDWADMRYQPITGHWGDLERELLAVWPKERIITPDEVRGAHATLPEAIRADGWPTLGKLRGRIAFSMLDSSTHRTEYTSGAPNLAGKLLFVDADTTDDPFAAMFKIDDAVVDADAVRRAVDEGFIVTSNVDEAGKSDDENAAQLAGSLESGAHFTSSDFDVPTAGYDPRIPGGAPARCHPRTAPAACTAREIEALE